MKTSFLYVLLVCCLPAICQEYNYIHYDMKDGLASSTVYRFGQDKKGYMWFATDNGVSMFDGKKFTNFTTDNGLSDNEVLYIMTDSKGRVWIMPFDNTVCYYYKGKIHSIKNDSTLRNPIFFSSSLSGENEKGDLFFSAPDKIFLLKSSGEIKIVADYHQLARQYSLPLSDFMVLNVKEAHPYGVILFNGQFTFKSQDDTIIYFNRIKSNVPLRFDFYKIDKDLKIHYIKRDALKAHKSHNHAGSYELYNTANGCWRVDSLGNIDPVPFLPGKNISSSFLDNEGNIWFATLGEGVYRLTAGSVKTFGNAQESFCIEMANSRIYTGLADGTLLEINNSHAKKIESYRSDPSASSSKRLYTLKSDASGNIYLGYDNYLLKINNKGRRVYSSLRPIKSIDIIDENHIVVCTNTHTLKLRSDNFKIVDTLWYERGTKVIYDKNSYYIGTLKGLVIVNGDKTITKTADHNPLLRKRIVDMCRTIDGGIWIATNDNGLILYKNGRVETVVNSNSGLSSNTCKSLFLKNSYLWVGTTKGINKLNIATKKVVAKYSTANGLPSDIINVIYIQDSIIWVGSSAGLTYFKEADITETSVCMLDFHSVYVSGKKENIRMPLYLSYKNNNISFDYTAISFKSAGDITYHYKLSGLDDDWKQTRLTTLSYPTLPSGDYILQLYAVNKFGKQSDTVTVEFHIAAPFWKTVWFSLTSLALVASLIWLLVNLRYKRLQNRTKEKIEFQRQIKGLEHAALRAQMNPHFIFNCLNSIQAFIIKNDIEQTNKYITRFGHLIRLTLDHSGKPEISLADELTYLTTYIELEQLRSSSPFRFAITIDPDIDTDHLFIPSMLLQPFIENAIRHGIRNKKGEGLIKLDIQTTAGEIIFHIEDNGIGREAAGKYKGLQRIEYQSKGMALTQNRIEVLNSVNTEKITTIIADILDQDGHIAGTKVTLSFPRSVMETSAAAE